MNRPGAEGVLNLFSAEHGHFLLESGYHASMWLNLETLFLTPARIDPFASELASRLSPHRPEIICGPLVEGAFLGLAVARLLDVPFTYSERGERAGDGLYPYDYVLPQSQRAHVAGKRTAIVNDVISAGSAVRGTARDLDSCGAVVVAIGALLVLGDWTRQFAAENGIGLEALAESPFDMATATECRQCKSGIPLQRRIQSITSPPPAPSTD